MLSAHDRWKDGKELDDPVAEEQHWNLGFPVDRSPVESECGKSLSICLIQCIGRLLVIDEQWNLGFPVDPSPVQSECGM
jgi:hypothetical protein